MSLKTTISGMDVMLKVLATIQDRTEVIGRNIDGEVAPDKLEKTKGNPIRDGNDLITQITRKIEQFNAITSRITDNLTVIERGLGLTVLIPPSFREQNHLDTTRPVDDDGGLGDELSDDLDGVLGKAEL